MRSWTVAYSSLLLLPLLALLPLMACGGESPAPEPPARSEPAAPAAGAAESPAPLTGASAAPGRERLDPDPHPELAHLTEVTTELLAQSISTYVQAESARHDGWFPVTDPEQQTEIELALTTVHRERLSQLGDGRYFACADFKGRDGHTYDVDIFMRRESTGLTPTEVIVHKQDGKPRFDWVERNGTWSQVRVTAR
jgi:hypothetical protein